ncbi:MAG: family PLP-dependent enzyme [Bacteroidota bacterium]|nr:family PLP-dependent enzyme [Bacteroidota bacterium]
MEKAETSNEKWYLINNEQEVYSPALLVYPDRIEHNIQKMIETAGSVNKLRPHVKTHKMAGIIKLQMKHGINKFKCATISETEMVARCGAKDILLAMQPVGPNLGRYFRLMQEFPDTKISCITDTEEVIINLSDMAVRTRMKAHVWLDINNGMNRTGVVPDERAESLYRKIINIPMLVAEGLHVYDGHIHEKDLSLRKKICDDSFTPVKNLTDKLKISGIDPVLIIAGGTPTFPVHSLSQGVELSPGTTLFWEFGY